RGHGLRREPGLRRRVEAAEERGGIVPMGTRGDEGAERRQGGPRRTRAGGHQRGQPTPPAAHAPHPGTPAAGDREVVVTAGRGGRAAAPGRAGRVHRRAGDRGARGGCPGDRERRATTTSSASSVATAAATPATAGGQ